MKGWKLSEGDIETIKFRYLKGDTAEEIAKDLPVGKTGVWFWIKKLGLVNQGLTAKYNKYLRELELSETEKAWLAGFIDGEGWIGIESRGNSYGVRFSVANTDKETMEYVKDLIPFGYLYRTKKEPPSKDLFTLELWNLMKIKAFLETIIPYSVTKVRSMKIALRFIESRIKNRGLSYSQEEMEMRKEIMVLNRRGRK